jgi:glyoxylase-like metal-dependent hydrolase (beta-lactamase superfamily II)
MVRVFSTGRVRQKRGTRGIRRYFLDNWGDTTLPVNVFLIEHPQGLCLVDAGQTAAAQRGYFPAWHPFFRLARFELGPDDEAAAQIAAAGYDPGEIRWVVLTHLHTDHVGGLAAFAGAEVLVSRAEWNRAQGLSGRLRGYLPQHWPPNIQPRVIDFHGPAVGPFSGCHDVASDGQLLFVPLPGHTPGHAALVVRIGPAQAYLCAGDAAPTAAELTAAAPAVAEWCRRNNVTILTSHDDAAGRLLAGSPAPGAVSGADRPVR